VYSYLSDAALALMIRALNTELNVIAKHFADGDLHQKGWIEQYNELNAQYINLLHEDERRTTNEYRIDCLKLDHRHPSIFDRAKVYQNPLVVQRQA
jgi:hypothetical protein